MTDKRDERYPDDAELNHARGSHQPSTGHDDTRPAGESRDGEPSRDPHDPVAAFFAQERSTVTPEPADDLRWQRIAREGRRRTPVGAILGGVAAAALAVVVGIQVVPDVVGDDDGSSEAGSAPIEPAMSPTPREQDDAPNAAAEAPQEDKQNDGGAAGAAPDDVDSSPSAQAPEEVTSFEAGSVTAAPDGTLWMVGKGPCNDGACLEVRSSKDGANTTTKFAPGAAYGGVPRVRFVDDKTGFVTGTHAYVTRDAGQSWEPLDHAGEELLAVGSDGEDVVAVSAGECSQLGCSEVTVTRDPATSTALDGTVARQVLDVELVTDAQVSFAGSTAVVVPLMGHKAQPAGESVLTVADDGTVSDVTDQVPGDGQFAGVAETQPGATHAQVLRRTDEGPVVASTDGSSWSQELLPAPENVQLLASGAPGQIVVADPEGPQVTTDAGQTWSLGNKAPASDGRYWVDLTVPEENTYYATRSDGLVWRSTDGARSWLRVEQPE